MSFPSRMHPRAYYCPLRLCYFGPRDCDSVLPSITACLDLRNVRRFTATTRTGFPSPVKGTAICWTCHITARFDERLISNPPRPWDCIRRLIVALFTYCYAMVSLNLLWCEPAYHSLLWWDLGTVHQHSARLCYMPISGLRCVYSIISQSRFDELVA